MSNDKSQRNNNNNGLAILTVAGILEFTAGMIWYNLFSDDIRRKKLFKKMKYYQSRLLEEMI
jgi:hypothetical protein